MLLAIDIGNTRTKAAVFEDGSLLEAFAFDSGSEVKTFENIFSKYPKIDTAVTASVGAGLVTNLPAHVKLLTVSRDWPMPFKNLYGTPETLGIDRMVLAAGATLAFPGLARLVIDAGTCVTYDFITDKDEYMGGAISPGMRLRYKSLHDYTAGLPLLQVTSPDNFTGRSTAGSIHSGIVNGIVCEIDGFIDYYRAEQPNFIIILTGGDAEFLAGRLKNTIFAHSNFLLESVNRIYHYKINK